MIVLFFKSSAQQDSVYKFLTRRCELNCPVSLYKPQKALFITNYFSLQIQTRYSTQNMLLYVFNLKMLFLAVERIGAVSVY